MLETSSGERILTRVCRKGAPRTEASGAGVLTWGHFNEEDLTQVPNELHHRQNADLGKTAEPVAQGLPGTREQQEAQRRVWGTAEPRTIPTGRVPRRGFSPGQPVRL